MSLTEDHRAACLQKWAADNGVQIEFFYLPAERRTYVIACYHPGAPDEWACRLPISTPGELQSVIIRTIGELKKQLEAKQAKTHWIDFKLLIGGPLDGMRILAPKDKSEISVPIPMRGIAIHGSSIPDLCAIYCREYLSLGDGIEAVFWRHIDTTCLEALTMLFERYPPAS